MASVHGEMHGVMHGKYDTVQESMDARTQFMEKMVAHRKTVSAAFKSLFDSMTADQKSQANHLFNGGCHGMGLST